MPKQRITKAMVVDAAFEVARTEGPEAVMVKNIADRLGCSVQPIYSYCQNMSGLRAAVAARAAEYIRKAVAARTDPDDLFRSTGRAYVQIAKEEPHLFRMFLFQTREDVASLQDLYGREASPGVAEVVAESLGIGADAARELHLNMLIYTIGIGTIFAVCRPGIPEEEIYRQQEQAYRAFLAAGSRSDNQKESTRGEGYEKDTDCI